MDEYFQLQQNLLLVTLIFSGIIFLSVWWAYSLISCAELFNRSVHWCGLLENVGKKRSQSSGVGKARSAAVG
jgi:hypothetical protein